MGIFVINKKTKNKLIQNIMKKFLTILLISVMTSTMAFAQYRNQTMAQTRKSQVGLVTSSYTSTYGRSSRSSVGTTPRSTTYSRSGVSQSRTTTTSVAKPLSPVRYYTNSQGTKVQSPTKYSSVPAGATARCKDGTFSFSRNKRGTCSHHGGVAEWL